MYVIVKSSSCVTVRPGVGNHAIAVQSRTPCRPGAKSPKANLVKDSQPPQRPQLQARSHVRSGIGLPSRVVRGRAIQHCESLVRGSSDSWRADLSVHGEPDVVKKSAAALFAARIALARSRLLRACIASPLSLAHTASRPDASANATGLCAANRCGGRHAAKPWARRLNTGVSRASVVQKVGNRGERFVA